jgi:ATP-dependent NAD(P)H-hydrate dehydratase
MVTRTTSRLAFKKAGRSLVTQDMLSDIGYAFAETFGDDEQFDGKL